MKLVCRFWPQGGGVCKGAILLLLLLALATARQADGQPWERGWEWLRDPRLASELHLTADQQAKLQSRHQALMEELTPLRDRLLGAKMEVRALMSHARPDRSRIAAKQQEVLALRGRLQELLTAYWQDCQDILTPEQRRKLATLPSGRGCPWCGPGRGGRGR